MKVEEFDAKKFDVKKFDEILARGLSNGLGVQGSQVCIEAAICETLGLPHGDDPGCVGAAVRAFKISLNDSRWSSPKARAEGMRDLGLAQLGSKSVNDVEFVKRLSEKLIRVLVPKLFRQIFPENGVCLAAADRCEKEGTLDAADAAYAASLAANAADAASLAANAAASAAAAAAAYAAASAATPAYAAYAANTAVSLAANAAAAASLAANAANAADEYLKLAAEIALETLCEMESPGVVLIG